MKKALKKGFTLVELLVVIAILAILATVSVVGYTKFIEKANRSVDEQAVTQINTFLEAYETTEGKPEYLSEAIVALDAAELDIKDYTPLSKGCYFYWVKSLNRVILADGDDNILYPEGITEKNDWYTLDGRIETDDSWEASASTTATISSGEELYDFSVKVNSEGDNKAKEVETINLTGTIDLKGAAVTFNTISKALNILGPSESNPATIKGYRLDEPSREYLYGDELRGYGHGLLGTVNANVTLKNIVIEGANIYDLDGNTPSQYGIIAGTINNGGTVTLENVIIRNSSVTGAQKVGALVGQIQGNGKLDCKNVTVENVQVFGYGLVAKLVGSIGNTGCFSYDNYTASHINNVTVSHGDLVPSDRIFNGAEDTYVILKPFIGDEVTENDEYILTLPGVTQDFYWSKCKNLMGTGITSTGLTYYNGNSLSNTFRIAKNSDGSTLITAEGKTVCVFGAVCYSGNQAVTNGESPEH